MPVYEYECLECNRRFSRFFWRIADSEGAKCRCGSDRLEQLVSRVSMHHSEESRLEKMENSFAGLDEDNPRDMARAMRGLSQELGEEMPKEFDEMVGRLEAGESPEQIEADLGDSPGGAADTDNLF